MTPHLNRLIEMVQMSGHSIWFQWEEKLVNNQLSSNTPSYLEGGGGAMVLGKHPVPGRLTYLDNIRTRAYCACNRTGGGGGGGCLDIFSLVYHFSSLSFSL